MVGGIRQHFAAAVAVGVADDRLSSQFPDFAATTNLLHTDRVDLTEIKSPIDFIDRRFNAFHVRYAIADAVDVTLPYRGTYLEQFVNVACTYITLRATRG